MSDQSQGPGWWVASDGRWYPPESHPDYKPAPPPPPPPPPSAAGGQSPLPTSEPMEVKGANGTVIFDGRFVTIRREGAMARMTQGKGEKHIPVSSITAIQIKRPGLNRGLIQFTVPGAAEGRSQKAGGLLPTRTLC